MNTLLPIFHIVSGLYFFYMVSKWNTFRWHTTLFLKVIPTICGVVLVALGVFGLAIEMGWVVRLG